MLAKLTSKNQLTLPKQVTQAVGPAEYFDVQARGGQIVLTPVRILRADAVRAKLAELGIAEQDVADAIAWARGAAPVACEPPPVGSPVDALGPAVPASGRKPSPRRRVR